MAASNNPATEEAPRRRASMRPRFVLTALLVGLIAGGVYVTRFASFGESAVDPELVRLLERVPFDEEGNVIEYLDLEMARQGPTREFPQERGGTIVEPEAFGWGPQWPIEVSQSRNHPIEFEESFGYGFDDIDRTLLFSGEQFGVFVVLDGDASAALDRATKPPWAPQEVRSQMGAFDVLDWGDVISTEDRTRLREMGQTGQLTAFDGNVIFQTMSRDWLNPVLATQDGEATLAEQAQLMAGLGLVDYEDSLGLSALFQPDNGFRRLDGGAFLPLIIVETGLDGSSRVVLGFRAGADLDQIETQIQEFIDPVADLLVEGSDPIMRTFSRSDDFIVIDVSSDDPTDPFRANADLRNLIQNIFWLHPEILT